MKRKGLLLAAFAATALLGSFSASADWFQSNGAWYYQDDVRQELVTSAWRQINGVWYYFDDYGVMAANRAIYDGNRYYYLNESGGMVTSTWVKTVLPDADELRWTYFDEYGKAPTTGWKQIGGKTYHFTDGQMDYGLLDADGNMIDGDEEDGYRRAVYYCGSVDEGWRWENQWLGIANSGDGYRYAGDTLWLYFNGVGRKVTDRREDITYANGTTYKCTFDSNGVMTSEQQMNGNSSSSVAQARWVERVPTRSENRTDYENGTLRWFYQNASGSYAKNQMKKIGSYYYLFDSAGIMKKGLVLCVDGKYDRTLVDAESDIYTTKEVVQSYYASGDIYYFGTSGERRSGKVQVDLAEDTYTMGFASSGKALHGVSSNYLYDRGFLETAGDMRYAVKTVDGKQYLVNAAGSIMKSGTYTDADGYKYKVTKDGDNYTITNVN